MWNCTLAIYDLRKLHTIYASRELQIAFLKRLRYLALVCLTALIKGVMEISASQVIETYVYIACLRAPISCTTLHRCIVSVIVFDWQPAQLRSYLPRIRLSRHASYIHIRVMQKVQYTYTRTHRYILAFLMFYLLVLNFEL